MNDSLGAPSDKANSSSVIPNHSDIQSQLNRPLDHRVREYKYRCAQAIIFGLPVLGLQWFGPSLGGAPGEQIRWIAILQGLLTGWVTYVAAAGMLAEGVLLLFRGRLSGELFIASIGISLFLHSAISTSGIFFIGHPLYLPLLFHWVVLVLAIWCAYGWWRTSRQAASVNPRSKV